MVMLFLYNVLLDIITNRLITKIYFVVLYLLSFIVWVIARDIFIIHKNKSFFLIQSFQYLNDEGATSLLWKNVELNTKICVTSTS